MDTNQTHETSTPDADICGGLRTMSGQENQLSIGFASRDEAIARLCVKVFGATPAYADEQPEPETIEPIGLPVWNGIGQPGGVMPLYGIDKDGIPHRTSPLPEATFKGLDERPTPLSDRMREHLHMQFPATVGNIRLTTMLDQVADLERERDEARIDVELAAGELMIPLPPPGTDIARLLAANSITRRQRDNALSDFRQADTDSIRALHERNEAREQRDRLAEALNHCRLFIVDRKGYIADESLERESLKQKIDETLAAVKGGTQ